MTDSGAIDVTDKFRRLIREKCLIKHPESKTAELAALIEDGRRLAGAESVDRYFDFVMSDSRELDNLVGRLTTKETYFFRIPGQFESLRKNVFPDIEDKLGSDVCREGAFSANKKNLGLKIWSAGCSTGEEAYSIAMAMLEGIRYKRAWNIEILATDISREALLTARDGVYEKRSLSNFPEIYEKYIQRIEGGFRVLDDAKKPVVLRLFNLNKLISESETALTLRDLDGVETPFDPTGEFDIIFFRNVLIYFDIEAQQKLINKLYDCLKPGGRLFTGDVEQLYIYKHGFVPVENENAVHYRKP